MTNIELELVSDINLDQAFLVLARTLAAGRSTHRAGAWRLKPIQKHLQHARKHLDLLANGSAGEDHLAHAARRNPLNVLAFPTVLATAVIRL